MKKIFKLIAILLSKYGDSILIKPTMKCNLKCKYCIVNKTLGKRPVFNEVYYAEWIELLKKRKPQLVTFSGGEPFLYPYIGIIINYLTRNKIFVTVSTNLMSKNGAYINPSKYLWFYATNHKSNTELFKRNLRYYRALGFNVSVSEFGKQTIYGSHIKKLSTKQTTAKVECYAPDLRKFNSWIELEEHGL